MRRLLQCLREAWADRLERSAQAAYVTTACTTLIASALFVLTLACASAHAAALPPGAIKHRAELTRNARAVWGLDAPVATFAAQVHQESRWRADAVSPVGAQGIAQFMPATTDWIAQAYPALAERQPFNPSWGLRALVTYDRHLWDRVKATSGCDRMAMTLSAYNGGLGWVWRDQKLAAASGTDRGRWFGQVERFNAGRRAEAWRENRDYPRLILQTHEPRYIAAGWGKGSCA
jgi:soluble lytic murein transglycosylase-like protein